MVKEIASRREIGGRYGRHRATWGAVREIRERKIMGAARDIMEKRDERGYKVWRAQGEMAETEIRGTQIWGRERHGEACTPCPYSVPLLIEHRSHGLPELCP